MKIIETKIYKCDHCGKVQFRKGDMTVHERWCKKNPNNMHKCFEFCKHLVKSQEQYHVSEGLYEGYSGNRTIFHCELTKKNMYSFIAERKKLPVVNDKEAIRMPLECGLYEDNNPQWMGMDADYGY